MSYECNNGSNSPVLTMFAGPNGSGKSTIIDPYLEEKAYKDKEILFVNADNIGRRIIWETCEDSSLRNDLIMLGRSYNPLDKKYNINLQMVLANNYIEGKDNKNITGLITDKCKKKNESGEILYHRLQKPDLEEPKSEEEHCLLIGVNLVSVQIADNLKDIFVEKRTSFVFETVMSSRKSIILLNKAKATGFKIETFYIITSDPKINVARIRERAEKDGHNVDEKDVIDRYYKSLNLLPQTVLLSDSIEIVNTTSGEDRFIIPEEITTKMFAEKDEEKQKIILKAFLKEHGIDPDSAKTSEQSQTQPTGNPTESQSNPIVNIPELHQDITEKVEKKPTEEQTQNTDKDKGFNVGGF